MFPGGHQTVSSAVLAAIVGTNLVTIALDTGRVAVGATVVGARVGVAIARSNGIAVALALVL